jgi:hypothetical protein
MVRGETHAPVFPNNSYHDGVFSAGAGARYQQPFEKRICLEGREHYLFLFL